MKHKHKVELGNKIISCANALILDYQIEYDQEVHWSIEVKLNGVSFAESSDE